MNFKAIRVRLTVWYLVILALGLGALGVGSWFAMRASLFHAVDHELEDRIKGVEKFMNEQIASLTLVEIRDEYVRFLHLRVEHLNVVGQTQSPALEHCRSCALGRAHLSEINQFPSRNRVR